MLVSNLRLLRISAGQGFYGCEMKGCEACLDFGKGFAEGIR